MFDLYAAGNSLARVAVVFGVTRQSAYDLLTRYGYKLRSKKPQPYVIFDGRRYTERSDGYWRATSGDRAQLHRAVWIFHHGRIPPRYDIHHRDRDRGNNAIDNLELIYCGTHSAVFGGRKNGFTDATHCIRGHAFDEANTYVHVGKNGKPGRHCKACNRIRERESRRRRRQLAASAG